jgi:hypothetical protein
MITASRRPSMCRCPAASKCPRSSVANGCGSRQSGKIPAKQRIASDADQTLGRDFDLGVGHDRAATPRACQKFLRALGGNHRGSLGHAVAERKRQSRRRRRLEQLRPGRAATQENRAKTAQPVDDGGLGQQPLQLRRHERQEPLAALGQTGRRPRFELFPIPWHVASAGQRTTHPRHEAAHVVQGQHADGVHRGHVEVGAKPAHGGGDRVLIVPGESQLAAGPAGREAEPALRNFRFGIFDFRLQQYGQLGALGGAPGRIAHQNRFRLGHGLRERGHETLRFAFLDGAERSRLGEHGPRAQPSDQLKAFHTASGLS